MKTQNQNIKDLIINARHLLIQNVTNFTNSITFEMSGAGIQGFNIHFDIEPPKTNNDLFNQWYLLDDNITLIDLIKSVINDGYTGVDWITIKTPEFKIRFVVDLIDDVIEVSKNDDTVVLDLYEVLSLNKE